MATAKPRTPLSFEDFVEAATTAALRAQKNVLKADKSFRPRPIWIGIIIRDFDDIEKIGTPQG